MTLEVKQRSTQVTAGYGGHSSQWITTTDLCFMYIINRAAIGGRGSRSTRCLFFRFVGELDQTSAWPDIESHDL